MPRILPDDRVRQGPSGRPVLAVLTGALLLCAVVFAGYMLWVGATSPDVSQQAVSTRGPSVAPSNANPTAQTPPANPAYPAPAEPSATGTTKQP
jgi:hypothetical protein